MDHHINFKYALAGIKYALTTQPNFRVHLIIGAIVLVAGIILGLSRPEWLIILLTMTLVLVAEMINTALESMTDLIEAKHHTQAKIAKDVSAGMVLLTAVAAVIVGVVIFAPRILSLGN